MIPHQTPFFLPWLYPSLVWRLDRGNRDLYLTFDDGPVAGPTEFVLDQLEKNRMKATFFCIGDNIGKYPHVFQRIVAGRHAVGNHTFNHLNGWKTASADYIANVGAFEAAALAEKLPDRTTLFRPPYGKITRRQISALRGYTIIMWDVLSKDYDRRLSPEQCLRRTINACRPGSIIVFHDSHKAEKNMTYTLPRLIDHFGGMGYRFRSLRGIGGG